MNASPKNTAAGRVRGFSLLELLTVVMILGCLTAVLLVRMGDRADRTAIDACGVHARNIEVQARLWQRNKGTPPAADLSDIGADSAYFPEGLPACPVSGGEAYAFDTASKRVTGHDH